MRIMLTITLACLTGCAGVSTDFMLGTKIRDGGFYGPTGPLATVRVRKPMGRAWCEYEHISHLTAGPPFGPSSEEDSLDQVGCGLTFGD